MSVDKCCTCGKKLTEQEKERYFNEQKDWMRKHPNWASDDCDSCAVKRLNIEKKFDSTTFMERVAEGKPEVYWLVAVIFLIMLVFLMASGR